MRKPLAAWTWVAVLTSRAGDSIVARKNYVSCFRDVELAAVYRVYRACRWGGKCEANNAKLVQESLSAAWTLTVGMRDVGVRFQVVGVFTQDKNNRKFARFSDCNTSFCIAMSLITIVWVPALRQSTEISSRRKWCFALPEIQ